MNTNWLDLLRTLGPTLVTMLVPNGALLAPILIAAIAEAEALIGTTGPAKRQHALALIEAGIMGVNTVAGRIVIPVAAALAIAGPAIDLVITIINMLDRTPRTLLPPAE